MNFTYPCFPSTFLCRFTELYEDWTGDDEEMKLLFFYVKPESNHDEDGVARCKCVAEFRVSRYRFMNISRDMNEKVKDIQREGEKISMFA